MSLLQDLCRYLTPEEVAYHVHLSVRHQYIYVETPKVACSTIKLMLQRLELDDPTYSPSFDAIHERASSPLLNPWQLEDFDEFAKAPEVKKFCFVRNPYSRVLSCYLDKIARDQVQKLKILNALEIDQPIELPVSFRDFVRAIQTQSVFEMDSHWRPQFFQNFIGILRFDLIGRFEQLNLEVENLNEILGGKLGAYFGDLRPHRTDAVQKMSEYYDADLIDQVHETYLMDFKYFGFSKKLCL